MSDPALCFDIAARSLNRQGEELCGDQVGVLRLPERTIAVLSDGLGSGVKANILARLTTTILVTMMREAAPLAEVLDTIAGTLPTCRVRQIAYATFLMLEIDHATQRFRVVNFDSPAPFLFQRGGLVSLDTEVQAYQGKTITQSTGRLERGDFLGFLSDGVLYAGAGRAMNAAWDWRAIATYLERQLQDQPAGVEPVVRSLLWKTRSLYGDQMGDDATFVGVMARESRRLLVFTGPPHDVSRDAELIERFLRFDGRKVVCGGTTSNLVARRLGVEVETEAETLRDDLPPAGRLPGVNLVTEGILTLARALQLLRGCGGDAAALPETPSGAVSLCREWLRADSIEFLAGESVNPYYQNPLLPRDVSIRHNLVEQIAERLRTLQKAVRVEWV